MAWRFLKKLKMALAHDPETPHLDIYPKNPKTLIQKNMHPNVHYSIIYKSQAMEAAQVPISTQVGKTAVGHIYKGICMTWP